MSGHSKWHNIQKTKGAADAKRSQIFTKIAREMIVAVKTGGSGDPNNNSRLATVIAKAKAANMPNDNIKRTIDKALGSGNADSYENVVYEGYGPSGVAVIVDALTDNRNRTAPEVRHLLDKYGKGLGATGCVSWSFDRKGVILIEKEDLDEDTVMMDALDAGADIDIIGRDNISWLVDYYGRAWPYDAIVIDELSSFKSHQSKRFKALKKVRPLSKRVIGLTGTPAPNSYIDLWPQLYLLDRGARLGKTISIFRDQFCIRTIHCTNLSCCFQAIHNRHHDIH